MSVDQPPKYSLRIRNAAQVVMVCSNREKILKGAEMQKLVVLDAAPPNKTLSVVTHRDGLIAAVGFDEDVDRELGDDSSRYEREIDARGMCVLPGLVDAHTHPVWVGDRVHEFALKVRPAVCYVVHYSCQPVNTHRH